MKGVRAPYIREEILDGSNRCSNTRASHVRKLCFKKTFRVLTILLLFMTASLILELQRWRDFHFLQVHQRTAQNYWSKLMSNYTLNSGNQKKSLVNIIKIWSPLLSLLLYQLHEHTHHLLAFRWISDPVILSLLVWASFTGALVFLNYRALITMA